MEGRRRRRAEELSRSFTQQLGARALLYYYSTYKGLLNGVGAQPAEHISLAIRTTLPLVRVPLESASSRFSGTILAIHRVVVSAL